MRRSLLRGPLGCAVGLVLGTALLAGCASNESEEAEAKAKEAPVERPVAVEGLTPSLYDAAEAAERAKNYASAVTFYNSLHSRHPDEVRASLGLARNLRYLGAAAAAVEILKGAATRTPDDPTLAAELGKAQLAAGQPDAALASLLRARDLAPGNWRVLSALGITYDRLGRYDAARLNYQEALDRSSNNVVVLNNLALSYVQTEELDKGIELLERAASQATATVQVRQNLALLYALRGDIDEAEKLARQDLPEKLVRKNVEYYRRLGTGRARVESGGVLKPMADVPDSESGTVPVHIEPWEEDTDAERTSSTAAKDTD